MTRNPETNVDLVYADSGELADALERGTLDAALIPSIEYLRGVGSDFVGGPALVANGKTGSLLLAANRPLDKVRRVAVDENSRTPLAVLRFVLDKLHHSLPDFCVFKAGPNGWQDEYDGVLLTGDVAFRYQTTEGEANETFYDIAEMWQALHPSPLVVSLWAYNDERLRGRLENLLVRSRDYGVDNLRLLSDGVAHTLPLDGKSLYEYFSSGWRFDMGEAEADGLRVLQDYAFEYQLIHEKRLNGVGVR
jgi:chorismate dehydratase